MFVDRRDGPANPSSPDGGYRKDDAKGAGPIVEEYVEFGRKRTSKYDV